MQENVLFHSELEIGEFASPNANHFWGNCESLWPTDLQFFFVTANQFWPNANNFCKWIRKKTLFFGPHAFLRKVLCN